MRGVEYTLAAQCGVTFAGIKAASLFSLKRGDLGALAQYERHFLRRGVRFVKLKTSGERTLVYVYDRKKLNDILFQGGVRSFLSGEGYGYNSCEEAIDRLKQRINGSEFPHEVGIFLGYPLEDVTGFISDTAGRELCGYC